MDSSEATPPRPAKEKKSRKGCFLFGCLGCIVIAIGLAVSAYFGFDYIVDSSLNTFTDAEAIDMDALRAERQKLLQDRRSETSSASSSPNSFSSQSPSETMKSRLEGDPSITANTASTQTPSATAASEEIIELDEEELNEFIAISPEFKDLKDNVYLLIEDDELYADVSYPLDEFASVPLLSGLEGRYFNGRVQLEIAKVGDALDVRVIGGESQGVEIPKQILEKLSTYNIAEKYNKDPATRKLLSSIQSVYIENGRLRWEFK